MLNVKELILEELHLGTKWTKRVFYDIDEVDWKKRSGSLKTNINWQLGHILASHYFHGIVCISGSNEVIKAAFSPKMYSLYYGMNSDPFDFLAEKPEKEELLENFELVEQTCIELVSSLDDAVFDEKTVLENPMAKNKKEALLWTIRHRTWHNGQAALIKSHLKNGH